MKQPEEQPKTLQQRELEYWLKHDPVVKAMDKAFRRAGDEGAMVVRTFAREDPPEGTMHTLPLSHIELDTFLEHVAIGTRFTVTVVDGDKHVLESFQLTRVKQEVW